MTKEEIISTAAIEECMIHVIRAAIIMAKIGSFCSVCKIMGRSSDFPKGRAFSLIRVRASKTNPKPMIERAMCLSFPLCSNWRCMMTPLNKRRGINHDKSKVRTCATKVVPTSAPITTAMPAAVEIARFEAKEAQRMAAAVELWSTAVMPMPVKKAFIRLQVLLAMIFCREFV